MTKELREQIRAAARTEVAGNLPVTAPTAGVSLEMGMSLAIEIRDLAVSGQSDRFIAELTGARPEYIRAVRSRKHIVAKFRETPGPKSGPRPYRVGLTWAGKRVRP